MMQLNPINTFVVALMLGLTLVILFLTDLIELPSANSAISPPKNSLLTTLSSKSTAPDPFRDLFKAYKKWDSQVGCDRFREKHKEGLRNGSISLQDFEGEFHCSKLKMKHVSVLVKGWTWIPDNVDNLYSCRCGLSCLWTKSSVLADKPDALLFETTTPPLQELVSALPHGILIEVDRIFYHKCDICRGKRKRAPAKILTLLIEIDQDAYLEQIIRSEGDPLRVYMDLEAGRKRSGYEDIFISYHAKDDVQSTYAGALFHNNRNYHLSYTKNNDTLVYWSSSRCLPRRNQLAKSLLQLLPHHSFGKCLNNVGGLNQVLSFYPDCVKDSNEEPKWWDHIHCAMSHYKFVLAIENTATESYVTEKLFYALDSGAVPIYFGAPNVWDFVPPHSIIDGTKFSSMEELASFVKALANDRVAYAEYHAWRRCGVLGNYGKTRATSLDTLPCRLCEIVSKKNGRNARVQ